MPDKLFRSVCAAAAAFVLTAGAFINPCSADEGQIQDDIGVQDVQDNQDVQNNQDNQESPEKKPAETEFRAPDTYPAVYAPSFTSETSDGISYMTDEDTGEVTVEGYRGDSAHVTVPPEIEGKPVTKVAVSAFAGCDKIKSVELPESVTEIGEEAFAECEKLKSVVIHSKIDKIGIRCFSRCGKLESVILPDTVKIIDDFAFEKCISLKTLAVPASVESIGYDVFDGCESLVLDCSLSEIGAQYALQANIPTDFSSSWDYTVIIILISTAVLGAAVFTVFRLVSKKKKK